ncbi:MAG: DNA mismatch repair endonuclease MutL [candidate division WOR-3 bacterium]|nr:MAG: DNA mismatch repair endonuclease MutL [candidate division WOR-3 bacterium]
MKRARVRVLPETTVRRIAAGEVVTRPAAAVKELVENSLDAGATDIRVEVKAGGKDLIKIADNGTGMSREDLRLAVARHATSKLGDIGDLRTLSTFGFRGEALASIAAVSRMKIETNTDDGKPGTLLEVEGGDIRGISETAHPVGTTIAANALFYNLPARRRFLRSDSYEMKLVAETVKAYAVAYPEISFNLFSNARRVFAVRSTSDRRSRLADLYDKQIVEAMMDVDVENPILSLHGWLLDPSHARRFYEAQLVYFNGRPVRSRTVVRAVHDGYGPVLGGRNPDFVLCFSTDPSKLDVNIHPTKQEVRFADERFLFDFVSEAVHRALGAKYAELTGVNDFMLQRDPSADDVSGLPEGFWQLHNSYILAQVTSGYVMVDQHAAHERVLFEEVTKGRKQMASQGLLFPINVDLTATQFAAYDAVKDRLPKMGIQTKLFSGHTVVVETTPAGAYMGKNEIRDFFVGLADARADKAGVDTGLAKLIACKGAVKAGQRLSQPEMESLFNRLFACEEPYFCPHGRPAIIRVTLDELERKFGRS